MFGSVSLNERLSLHANHDALNEYFSEQVKNCEYWKNIAAYVCKVALAALATSWVISSFFKAAPFLATVITLTPVVIAAIVIYKQRTPVAANLGLWDEIQQNKTIAGVKVDTLIYYSKMASVAGLAYLAVTSLAFPALVGGGVTYFVMSEKISKFKKLQSDLKISVELKPPKNPFSRFLSNFAQP